MYLKEVIINGFKSFAEKTRLALDPGVTCIVGPNGCGKSNIVDAIRWVLGEQSAKALRGGKMYDIIFAGTDQRKPLNMCEVSLVFSDCEKELGTAFNEVEITRRVSVDGGSDYFLNGKACRLKDIQALFMDTGVGRVSYSFMVQGQIDQILSSNPADRRVIFEEAAGITRYKSQRKEALNKLALVEQNLSRLTDVVQEVDRQIGSLKRQASKALRYKKLKHRLTHLDLAQNAYRFHQRVEQVESLVERVQKLRIAVEARQESLKTREESLESVRFSRESLYEQLQQNQQTVFDIKSEKEHAQSQAEYSERRIQDLSERITFLQKDFSVIEQERAVLDTREREEVHYKQQQLNLVGNSDEVFKQKNSQLQSLDEQLKQAEAGMQAAKQELVTIENERARFRINITQLEVELKTAQAQKISLSENIAHLEESYKKVEESLKVVRSELQFSQEEKSQAQADLEQAQQEIIQARQDFRKIQEDIQLGDRTLAKNSAELSLLEDMQAKFEGFSEGAKAILQGKVNHLVPQERLSLLTKHIQVNSEYAIALETLIGAAMEAIVLENSDDLLKINQTLVDQNLGRACLQIPLPVKQESALESKSSVALPASIRPVTSEIQIKNQKFASFIQKFFVGYYFTNTLEEFLQFLNVNPGFQFIAAVTQNAEWIDSRGVVFIGRRKGQGKETSFIQRDNEIQRLQQFLKEKSQEQHNLHEAAAQAQQTLDKAEEKVEEKRLQTVELGQMVSGLQAQEKATDHALFNASTVLSRVQKQREELEDIEFHAEERLGNTQEQAQSIASKFTLNTTALREFENKIQAIRLERDSHFHELSEARIELAENKQRLEILDRELTEIERKRRDLQDRKNRGEEEIKSLSSQTAHLKHEIENAHILISEQDTALQEILKSLDKTRTELNQAETQLKELEQAMSAERTQQHAQETELNGLEIRLAEERSQMKFVTEKVQSEYQQDVHSIDWKDQLWKADEEFETRIDFDDLEDEEFLKTKTKKDRGVPAEEDFAAMEHTDWPAIANEVKEMRERIASMGAINLVAIEEYASLRERHEFLSAQNQDLIASRDCILKAIDEINQTSQQLFKDTFEQVRNNFKFTFESLFGGGVGDLNLMEESEDPLESGIEIIARPPGTKLRSISLLSGGQKTMTAVALLFAIYMVKPSPFCVLDELDAPLDDANVGRFTNILREFTKYSQFLVVTHNKRTIAAADTIYGVTMQERGVTQMIAMRFNKELGEVVNERQEVMALE